ncbi:hypothetical protein [Isoptericola hypogeus]|uniref:hypothetical protein n=1 Tax=Isoptericola hypogeus TaxID=300179 RepID=UPI0031DE26D6
MRAAARALAAEAGLEVAVQQVNELDGDEDVEATPAPTDNHGDHRDHHDSDDRADDDRVHPAAEVDAGADDDAHEPEPDEEALAERRRAILAESEALMARGRQWDHLRAGKETAR